MQQPKHETLCWNCEKACGKCSWSREFKPVEGWEAKSTKIYQYATKRRGKHYRYYTDSFDVYECPEFEPLKAMNPKQFIKKIKKINFVKIEKENQREEKKRQHKELVAKIYKMLGEGKRISAIAKETGVSRSTIYRFANKRGK